jgi:hypothetical protein
VEVFNTSKCGYGLKASDDIQRGTLIIEYLGSPGNFIITDLPDAVLL